MDIIKAVLTGRTMQPGQYDSVGRRPAGISQVMGAEPLTYLLAAKELAPKFWRRSIEPASQQTKNLFLKLYLLGIPDEWVSARDYSESELEVRKTLPAPFDRYLTYVIDSAAPYSVITLMLHLWSLQTSYPKL